jgi:hypothetical protein
MASATSTSTFNFSVSGPTSGPIPRSVTMARSIVGSIASHLLAAMHIDVARELAMKIKLGTFSRDDYEIVQAACSASVYRQFKRNMRELEMVREGEAFSDGARDKRKSIQAKHKDEDYFEAVAEHAAQCNRSGGFVAGSRLHWRPADDEERAGDSSLEQGVKRKRLVRPNDED